MKRVFTTLGDNMDAPMDGRFGRARKFLIYDLDTNTSDRQGLWS
jgi:predicted Fe-Mo cluster-binding NifX family protein